MAQVQTIELPQHLDPLFTVDDVAAGLNVSGTSTAPPKPTKKTGAIRNRWTPGRVPNISNIDLVNWLQVHTADDHRLHPCVCEGSHDA
jgi:hypothetical protein